MYQNPPTPADRTFNKDLAFLYELQRLETISNNFAIENKHEARLRTLQRWKGSIIGVLSTEEQQTLYQLITKCKPIKCNGKLQYDTESLDQLHDTLNLLNTKHKLQLTKRLSGVDAAKIV